MATTREWSWIEGQNREVVPAPRDDTSAPPAKIPDEWWERLVKGVPVEAVGAYTAIVPFARIPGGDAAVWALLIVFVLGLVFTYFAMTVLRKVTWDNADPAVRRIARIQIVIALVAFAVWAYAQGGFFAAWHLGSGDQVVTVYQDWVAGMLTIIMGCVLMLSDKITGAQ